MEVICGARRKETEEADEEEQEEPVSTSGTSEVVTKCFTSFIVNGTTSIKLNLLETDQLNIHHSCQTKQTLLEYFKT